MAWILLIVGGTFLCRMAVMQFAAHMDDRIVQSAWQPQSTTDHREKAGRQKATGTDNPMSDHPEVNTVRTDRQERDAAPRSNTAALAATTSDPVKKAKPEVPGRWKGWRKMTVEKTVDESPDCRSFYFRPIDGQPLPEFMGGQYVLVGCKDPDTGKVVSRCYSLSDAFDPEYYRVTVRRIPGGKVSNLLHETVKAGDEIELRAPGGRFHLDAAETEKPLNLIAAGIGITPMISMLRHAQRIAPDRSVRLFYQLRASSNAPFLAELRKAAAEQSENGNFQLFVAFSRPDEGGTQPQDATGRIAAKSILQACKSSVGSFMICGPESFMTNIAAGLVAGGVRESDVQYESFGGGKKGVGAIAVVPATEEVEVNVETASPAVSEDGNSNCPKITFAQSDQSADWNEQDESLLETAERVGVDVESGCRSGQCGSCAIRLIKGAVKYSEEPDFAVEDDEVLMCVAKPCGPVSIDA